MDYSYIDNKNNENLLIPQKQSGLYGGNDESFLTKLWGSRCKLPAIQPDAAEYCKYFYVKNQIPSYQTRPGNNEPKSDFVKDYDDKKYNLSCMFSN